MLFAILLPILCIGVSSAMGDEPKCSRFEFEKHLLEMLVRLEFELSQTNQKLGLTEKTMQMEIEELKQGNRNMTTELAASALTEETLKMEIEELKQGNRNMTTELAASALTEKTMQMEIEELKQGNRNMTSELAASALTEETMKREIEELKQNDRNRGTELATFKDQSTRVSQNLNEKLAKEIEDGIQSMELKLANLTTSTSGSRIYFFGTRPGSSTINDRPIFQTMHYNEGDSYDASTGLFTCRVPGLYHFAFGFSSKADKNAYCWFYRNDDKLVHTYAKGQYNSGSVAAYLHLDVGNTVDIRCPSSYWTRMLHDRSMWYTGALIRR